MVFLLPGTCKFLRLILTWVLRGYCPERFDIKWIDCLEGDFAVHLKRPIFRQAWPWPRGRARLVGVLKAVSNSNQEVHHHQMAVVTSPPGNIV